MSPQARIEGVTPAGLLPGQSPRDRRLVPVTIDVAGTLVGAITAGPPTLNYHDAPLVLPGLIDGQVNGYDRLDLNDGTLSTLRVHELCARLAEAGTTTWLPTLVTAEMGKTDEALRVIQAARLEDPIVAQAIPGVHLEGPFLDPTPGARGVHREEWIREPNVDELAKWVTLAPIRVVTLSPHWANAPAITRWLVSRGIRVAIGHTNATDADISAVADAGASLSTHLGNGVPTELPRHPNPIWSQLADDRLAAGLIADGHHLPLAVLKTMLRAKGQRRAYLVSDTNALAGSPPGIYRTPVGTEVELSADGRLAQRGTSLLAGAAVPLFHGLRLLVNHELTDLIAAVTLATVAPARHLGIGGSIGRLRVGGPANVVMVRILGSSTGRTELERVESTWFWGRQATPCA